MNKKLDRTTSEGKESQYHHIFDTASDGLIISDLETGLVVEANPAACSMHGYAREEFIGLPLNAILCPDNQPDNADSRTQHKCRDGSMFYAEGSRTAITFQGRPCLLRVVCDVSKRIQAEQALYQRIENRTREQTMLLDISHTLASTLEFQPDFVLNQLREIVEYIHGGLFTFQDSTLVTLALHGVPHREKSLPLRIHLHGSESLDVLFNGHRPIRIADVWSDNPQAQFLRLLLDDGTSVLLEGMQSWMWVPLAVKKRMIGGIGMAHEKQNFFTPHHAALALSVADQVAATMINAELYENAQALAVMEERQRLARNLHDAVNQSLFSAGLIAEVLPRLWDRDQALARQSLEDLRRLTRGAQAEMRALLVELQPATLTDANLGDLLNLLGNAFTGRTNIQVEVIAVGEGALPAEVQRKIYRICQEALNNVAKHAAASKVEINLKHEGKAIELRIRDDGQGFDPEKTPSGHYGLRMMRERADAINAQLSIISQPGHGTELILFWAQQEGL